jgi:hypothetical protein
MVDLWAEDISVSTLRPPVVILREQASLLGQKTKNIVTAEVRSSTDKKNITHSFFIVAPALDNYRYGLFSIVHNNIELYPVYLDSDWDMMCELYGENFANQGENIKIDSEDEFIDILGKILKSKKTKRVVHSLLTQSSGDFFKFNQVAHKEPPPTNDEDIPF